jgi:hypothetical protein
MSFCHESIRENLAQHGYTIEPLLIQIIIELQKINGTLEYAINPRSPYEPIRPDVPVINGPENANPGEQSTQATDSAFRTLDETIRG